MAKRKRDYHKRLIGQAGQNIDWAGSYIRELEQVFRPQHPQLAEGLTMALLGLYQVEQTLRAFALVAWGAENVDWVSWTGQGKPLRQHILEDNNNTDIDTSEE